MSLLLTEAVILSLAGGIGGVAIAFLVRKAVISLLPIGLSPEPLLNSLLLSFTFLLSMVAGVTSGLVPFFLSTRLDLNVLLQQSGPGFVNPRTRGWIERALVAAEVAVCLVLLTGAALMTRSFVKLTAIDLGFDSRGILTGEIWLPNSGAYGKERQVSFFKEVLQRVGSTPGVQAVGITSHLPLTMFNELGAFHDENMKSLHLPRPVSVCAVSSDYFSVMKIPLLKGRLLRQEDFESSAPVALINVSLDRLAYGGTSSLGHHIALGHTADASFTIVGVVGDVRNLALEKDTWPEVYVPYWQDPSSVMTIAVRPKSDRLKLANSIEQEIRNVDRNQPLASVETMDDRISEAAFSRRIRMILANLFAFVPLVLVSLGIYGIVARVISSRTREIGIRIALGAGSFEVAKMIAASVLLPTGLGVFMGICASLGVSRFVRSYLFGVSNYDVFSFFSAAALIFAVAAFACYTAARRVRAIDPAQALHHG